MRLIPVVAGMALVMAIGLAMGSGFVEAEEGPGAAPPAAAMEPGPAKAAPPAGPRLGRRGCTGPERTLTIGPAEEPLHIGLETYPQTLELRDHEVVRTFDDGPSPKTTPRVLAALDAACVHATFFLIGRNASQNPVLAKRELADGNTVGHHSNTHPSFTLRGFDQASAEVDIDTGVTAVEHALYGAEAASPKHPHTPFFRFPGFADTKPLLQFLDERRYIVFGTDMWAADWNRMTPDHERRRVLGLLEAAPHHKGIILFHDTIESTAQMLPELLADLRRGHYTIVHLVYEAKAPRPPLEHAGAGWTSATEAIIAHLRRPIIPGLHSAGNSKPSINASTPREPDDVAGNRREEHPRAGADFRCMPFCDDGGPTVPEGE